MTFFFFKVDHKEAGQMSLEKAGQWVFMRTELGEVSHGPS